MRRSVFRLRDLSTHLADAARIPDTGIVEMRINGKKDLATRISLVERRDERE